MKKEITIAIDGWSSCGKSTLAKALAKSLNFVYVDSGAMYRGVALYALRKDLVSPSHANEEEIIKGLSDITLTFSNNDKGSADLYLNGENVEQEIRTITVSNVVSAVAKIKEVRSFLVAQQRKMGEDGGVVMDGRDIGSVVFPNAELKLFVTADPEIRAQRRYDELQAKGDNVSFDEVRENLKMRDEMDKNREESPLIQTEDAVVLDNSNLSPAEQLQESLKLVEARK
ncbi:(d)CMP kinase [Brumimicrobium aurantiacum]|uniref:Cytidylate kinase n=1 Tax=Brumimicrobium aurantiacum TaxID=1737063 RepID=A0A3E1EYU8_9FLAO|nr:(d)CMP kinase [Brumimicrobium aurantiacum]RFC54732.1 (d)CMP kinase [Brumimicrobium aurantiacum]